VPVGVFDIRLRGSWQATRGEVAPAAGGPEGAVRARAHAGEWWLLPRADLRELFELALTPGIETYPKTKKGQFAAKFRSIVDLDGLSCGSTLGRLDEALARMDALAPAFRDLRTFRCGGRLTDARWVIEQMRDQARRTPEHVWDIRLRTLE